MARPLLLVLAFAACAPTAPAVRDTRRIEKAPTHATSADHSTPVVVPDPDHGDSVWLAHASGGLERIWPPAEAAPIVWSTSGISGSDRMRPSSDAALIAFVRGGVLSVHDRQRATTNEIARAKTSTRSLVITDWSRDGSALLYALDTRADPSDPTFFRYDQRTRDVTRVPMPGEYAGWLSTGDFLVHAHAELLVSSQGRTRSLTPGLRAGPQVGIGADGRRVAVFVAEQDLRAPVQLVSIDTQTGERTPVGAPRPSGELQWPKWSPSGAKIACLESERSGAHEKRQYAWVDGVRVGTPSSELYDFAWIDDETLVLVEAKELRVLAVRNGAVLGRVVLP